MDDDNGATFSRPLDFARPPVLEDVGPPRVRVRMAQKDRVKFLELLDSCGRLALLPSKFARQGFENGLFVVPKDEARDRMVLDARPANCLEDPEKRWIRSLASVSQLLHFFVEPYEEIRTFAEDLREFYHAFLISPQRTLRNVLKFVARPHEVAHLRCFDKKTLESRNLGPGFRNDGYGGPECSQLWPDLALGMLTAERPFLFERLCDATRASQSEEVAGRLDD